MAKVWGDSGLITSDVISSYVDDHLAPVVSFVSAIKIKSGSGTTDDPYEIGK